MARRKPLKLPRRRRGSGSVAAQSDGTFWAIPPAWADPGRKPRRGFPTRAEAATWLDTECARARDPEAPATDQTLEMYLSVWYARISASADWAASTRAVHRTRIRAFVDLADVKVKDLRPSQLQDVVAAMARRGVGASVIRQTVGVIRRALADALDDGLVTRNVAARLVLPKARPAAPRSWTGPEARRLLSAVEGEPLAPLVVVGLVCGLRIGELLGLQWDDIDMASRLLTVRRSFSAGAVGPTKSRRERTVGMPEPVWAALLRYHERQAPGEVWVFPSWRHPGKPTSYTYATRWLKRMAEKAGVRYVGSHSMRHSAGSRMLTAGVDPADVARTLGHANPGVLLSTYYSSLQEGESPPEAVARWLAEVDPDPT